MQEDTIWWPWAEDGVFYVKTDYVTASRGHDGDSPWAFRSTIIPGVLEPDLEGSDPTENEVIFSECVSQHSAYESKFGEEENI